MRLLLIEDEKKLAQALTKALKAQGYAVDTVYDGDDGYAFAMTEPYDAMIIDRMLPGSYSGTDIITHLREQKVTTPILLLTALGSSHDKVKGLDSGADDYLVKPFDLSELFARIRALLRRGPELTDTVLTVDDLSIDLANHAVSRQKTAIKLTKTEYALLVYLARKSPNPVSKETLIEHVWDFDADILPNTVEVSIRNLRTKVDKPFPRPLIHTVRDVGYQLKSEEGSG